MENRNKPRKTLKSSPNVDNDPDFFKSVGVLVRQIKGMADNVFPIYKAFADNVIRGQIRDISQIEHNLDSMLSFCFDDRILLLFKQIMRKLYKQYPETVYTYVKAYRDMYEEQGQVRE